MRYHFLTLIFLPLLAIGQTDQLQKEIITKDQLGEWVSFLASDQMQGRRNGSPEMKNAASWISRKFSEAGLKPVPGNATFFSDYSYTSRQSIVNEKNIIGFIEGSDPGLKDEFIVLSAHFDHIGLRRGNPADSVCNGADDNASGTATLIGIARWIRESGIKPGRSIIFAAFSGEENGMRGSRYFVSTCPVPHEKIYANLNFEMTGHSELLGKKKYYMTGCLYSNLDDVIGEFNQNTDFSLIDTMKIANMLFNSSDNVAFSKISQKDGVTTGIPSGTFATTAFSDYLHNTTDEIELFDLENMAALVNHFSSVVLWLSKSKTEIVWTDPKIKRP
jgi:hypothetical protein